MVATKCTANEALDTPHTEITPGPVSTTVSPSDKTPNDDSQINLSKRTLDSEERRVGKECRL